MVKHKGVLSILQQIVRYGYHYGTSYSVVTDLDWAIILRMPDTWKERRNDGDVIVLEWTIVKRDNIPEALAFLIWLAMKKVRAQLTAALVQARATQPSQESEKIETKKGKRKK